MTYFEALIYGAVQGITEYLPISSSAHLILLPKFLGQEDPGLTFDVFLHLGTLLATLAYFWREWVEVVVGLPGVPAKYRQLVPGKGPGSVSWQLIAIATVPALIAGAALHHWVESVLRGNHILVGTLALGGLVLFLTDHYCRRERNLPQFQWIDALWIGIAQCFALVPGISRSGSTITGARILGFDRAAAARFSFMISAPVTAAAIVFELRHWKALFGGPVGMGQLLVAGFSSFAFGCVAIGALLRLIRNFGYLSFAIYRVALAFVVFKALGI